MNVLTIYAYPNPSSFNASILENVQKGLQETNHSVTLHDLYKEQFTPVLICNENKRRRDLVYEEETVKYKKRLKNYG